VLGGSLIFKDPSVLGSFCKSIGIKEPPISGIFKTLKEP
jgi:hypothetical protein